MDFLAAAVGTVSESRAGRRSLATDAAMTAEAWNASPTRLVEAHSGWAPEVEAELGVSAGAVSYRMRLVDGTRVLAKVIDRDQRDADWPYRVWRLVAFREPEDQAAIVTPAYRVAHEAYLSLLAQRDLPTDSQPGEQAEMLDGEPWRLQARAATAP
jgi:hypothetical protein